MRPIDISISHDHDAVISQVFNIKLLALNAQSEGCNQGLNLSVLVDLGIISFLNIEDLSAQRQNGLIAPITALFG